MSEWLQPDQQPPDGHHVLLYFLLIVVGGFVSYWLDCGVQAIVSSMYLRAREGEEPGGEQISEALHYRGFASLAGGLLLRYLGWFALLSAILYVAFILLAVIVSALSGATSGVGAAASGASAVGHGTVIGVVALLFVTVVTLIFYRYMFVFQMFAIERASEPGFLDECVRRTKQVWKTAALIMLVGTIPTYLILGIESLAWKHWTPPHGVHVAVGLAGAILTGCFTAWFMLVKTGLAMQLMSAPPPPLEPAEERPSSGTYL
jgi:magnesium-transporting ATPase (P-type)